MAAPAERDRLLPGNGGQQAVEQRTPPRHRAVASTLLLLLFISGLVLAIWTWEDRLSANPLKAAKSVLDKAPVIVRPARQLTMYADPVLGRTHWSRTLRSPRMRG